jgi:hypothetical protein
MNYFRGLCLLASPSNFARWSHTKERERKRKASFIKPSGVPAALALERAAASGTKQDFQDSRFGCALHGAQPV